MIKIQLLEREIKNLDPVNLALFRDWFRKYDSDAWDRQIEDDARSGKLDKFAKKAISDHKSGKSREL